MLWYYCFSAHRAWTFRSWRLSHASAAAPPLCWPPVSPSCPSSGKCRTLLAERSPSACLPPPTSNPCHRAKRLTIIQLGEEYSSSLPPTGEHSSDLKTLSASGRAHGRADWDQWALHPPEVTTYEHIHWLQADPQPVFTSLATVARSVPARRLRDFCPVCLLCQLQTPLNTCYSYFSLYFLISSHAEQDWEKM